MKNISYHKFHNYNRRSGFIQNSIAISQCKWQKISRNFKIIILLIFYLFFNNNFSFSQVSNTDKYKVNASTIPADTSSISDSTEIEEMSRQIEKINREVDKGIKYLFS